MGGWRTAGVPVASAALHESAITSGGLPPQDDQVVTLLCAV
jgi:hypothetical protein